MSAMNNKTFKMICEASPEIEMIKSETQDTSKPTTMKFRGCWLMSEVKNGNNRIYPYEVLKAEVDRFRTEMIDTSRALMELEHSTESEINPMRASARILSLEEDNKTWVGEGVILCSDEKFNIKGTPCGDVLASLVNYGTKFGVSSRALGEVNDDGIVTDLHLVTCDTVCNPSIGQMVTADGTRLVNGILESKQWVCNNHGQLVECAYTKFENGISKLPNTFDSKKKAEFIGSKLKSFFNDIKGF